MVRGPKDGVEQTNETSVDRKDRNISRYPLFYNAPRPLEAARHAKIALADNISAKFSANANAIPLNIVEFAVAARHYPLVFSDSAPFLPVAITGLRTGTNVFLDADGEQWARGCYVPAYVRRYPFILMENSEQQQFMLCVDEESGFLTEDGDRTLFGSDAKPTQITNKALEFCRVYQEQFEATQRFVTELVERGLLTNNSAEIRVSDDRTIQMQGFRVIDREKFEALPNDVFLEWRTKNWLPITYAHMTSLSNWSSVLQRAADLAAKAQDAG